MSAQNFRTDSAVVGPIKNADSTMTGGTVFVILAVIPGQNILYALGYDSNKVCKLLAGGLGVYTTGNAYPSSAGYVLPYFRYKKPVTSQSANYDSGDDYYTIVAYTDVAATANKVGSLKMDNTSGLIIATDANNTTTIQLVTDDASTFPGLPSLMTGVGYYMPEVDPTLIMRVPSTGTLTTGDYAGLPNTTPGTPVAIPTGTRFYACTLDFFGTSSCTDAKAVATNLIYYQCPRTAASTVAADKTATYYTTFCGTNAKTGLTSSSLCQLTNGTIPYYAYANGNCGDVWPADYTLTGMDGLSYTAKSTYGMSYDGLCLVNSKDSPTGYETMSLQDAFDQLIDDGDVVPPDNTSSGAPWWMWLLLVFLIIGIIILAVLLFMNMGKSGSKTEINSDGNVEKVTYEDK